MRMTQLLGLSPQSTHDYIGELWVKPGDLFRPAADPEIDDNTAGQYLLGNTATDYISWFNQNIYDSYLGSGTHSPWTRLGYTYDWARTDSEVGVSEYASTPFSLPSKSGHFFLIFCLQKFYWTHIV